MPDTLPSESVTRTPFAGNRHAKVAYFISHPIQYQAPLLRRISQEPDIDLKVFFSSDLSVRGYVDSGFGVQVKWDIPLLDGYAYEFLPRVNDGDTIGFATPLNWGVFRRLRAGGFDAVWVFGYNRLVCLQAIVAAKLLRIPVLIRTDSSLFDRDRSTAILLAKKLFFRILRPAVQGVISIGTGNTEYWRHYLGSQTPIYLMPYSIDNEYFRKQILKASPHRDQLRDQLGLERDRLIILFAAKLTSGKRCIDLVDAYARICKDSIDRTPYLLVIGDGAERRNLETQVLESGLSGVRFLGFRNQSELPALYDLCDLFVLPSEQDAWGLAVNEAMIAGKPVIVTDRVGCHPDLVHAGVNGFVYPAHDVDALACYLRQIIENPELRISMGENSLRLIQKYSFEQNVSGLRQALGRLVPGFEA